MTRTKWWIFALGLGFVVTLAAFNLFYGYSPTDDGFVLGFAWRVWNGEIPHRDFITIRPPLTPLIHQIWFALPERLQFPAARASFYVWMGLIWWVAALRLLSLAYRDRIRWIGVGLTALTVPWLFSIHNFPPTPWHTVDGILLSTLSILLLVEAILREEEDLPRSLLLWGLGALAAGLAPFVKQSFTPAPVLFVALAALGWPAVRRRGESKRVLGAALLGLFLGPALIAAYLIGHGAWADYLRQTGSAGNSDMFMGIAVRPYLHFNRGKIFGLATGILAAVLFQRSESRRAALIALFPAAFIAYKSVRSISPGFFHSSGEPFFFHIAWIPLILILRQRKLGFKASEWALGLGALAIPWMGSISMGYNFPILGFAVLGVFTAFMIARREKNELPPTRAMQMLAPILVLVTFAAVLRLDYTCAYRDVPRPLEQYDVAKIFPRFGPKLMAGHANYEQIRAARDLAEDMKRRYPDRPLIVYPEFPLFYYLTDRHSAFPLDWWISLDYPTYQDELIQKLQNLKPVVLWQLKAADASSCAESVYDSEVISKWIWAHSRILGRDGVYCALEVVDSEKRI